MLVVIVYMIPVMSRNLLSRHVSSKNISLCGIIEQNEVDIWTETTCYFKLLISSADLSVKYDLKNLDTYNTL